MEAGQSTRKLVWKRLRGNKPALVGLVLIGLAVLVALFAYVLAADPSPYANRILLEAGGNKPGFKTSVFVSTETSAAPSCSCIGKTCQRRSRPL